MFVEDLAKRLEQQKLKVWYDVKALQIGDHLEEKITDGIQKTEFGVVILSPHFLAKEWTKKELAILLKQRGGKILPIRFGLNMDEVSAQIPELASIRSVDQGETEIDEIVKEVVERVGRQYEPPRITPPPRPSFTYQSPTNKWNPRSL